MKPAAGFTLIEVLVGIVIIGILSGVLILSSGLATRDRSPAGEAERVLRLLHLFRNQSVNSAMDLGLLLRDNRMLFLVRSPEGWQSEYRVAQRQYYDIPESIRVTLELDGITVDTDEDTALPHIVFLSDGQISPFSLRLQGPGTEPVAINEALELVAL